MVTYGFPEQPALQRSWVGRASRLQLLIPEPCYSSSRYSPKSQVTVKKMTSKTATSSVVHVTESDGMTPRRGPP